MVKRDVMQQNIVIGPPPPESGCAHRTAQVWSVLCSYLRLCWDCKWPNREKLFGATKVAFPIARITLLLQNKQHHYIANTSVATLPLLLPLWLLLNQPSLLDLHQTGSEQVYIRQITVVSPNQQKSTDINSKHWFHPAKITHSLIDWVAVLHLTPTEEHKN